MYGDKSFHLTYMFMAQYQYYNPNPYARYHKNGKPFKWNIGDCSVRAICGVTGKKWREVFETLCCIAMDMCMMPNSDDVVEEYLRRNGFVKKSVARGKKNTADEFGSINPNGKYMLRLSNHYVALVDGVIKDTWDCREWSVFSYYVQQ